MLIINADDWGSSRYTTDQILLCYKKRRLTSASAMVYMEDSERAADLARQNGLEVGLHVNFTDRYTGHKKPSGMDESQVRLSTFLRHTKYNLVFYNPFLSRDFENVFRFQYDEFIRLYGRPPAHINGHHHKHLCANVLWADLLPQNSMVRRSFSFSPGEKSRLNRFYRRLVDRSLQSRYTTTDFFFSIQPIQATERLLHILELARSCNVELMVHPHKQDEFDYLMSDRYAELISGLEVGTYIGMVGRKRALVV